MRTLPCNLLLILYIFADSPAFAQFPAVPDKQQQFLSIVDDFAEKYKSAKNEMAQGALRPQRAKAICDLLKDGRVKDWVGTVQKLSSNNEGKGVLYVSMSKIANANTWNNALSDMSDKTLIEPGTPLHEAAIQLSRKQTVVFIGTFIKGDKDCFRESSLTQRGSMTDPDWIFRFSAVKPAELSVTVMSHIDREGRKRGIRRCRLRS